MRYTFKLIHTLSWLLIFYLRSFFFRLITPNPVKRRQRLNNNTTFICRHLMSSMHFTVRIKGSRHLTTLTEGSNLVISNHASYTDILVLASIRPFPFITSVEMGANRFLGGITRCGGSLYTDRRKHTSLPQEIENFAGTVREGFNVVLFPEGTSTNGETVKAFHKSLFQVAVSAKAPIQPVCIKYRRVNGESIITQKQRDLICWYGDMEFAPHFLKLLRHRIEVEVNFLEPIPWQDGATRQKLAEETYGRILNCFQSVAD